MKLENVKQHIFKNIFGYVDESIKDKVFVAGGCIRDLLNDNTPKDYDIFCTSEEVIDKLKNNLLDAGASVTSEYDKYVNLSFNRMTIQIVKLFTYKTPQELIDTFDFTICQACVFCEKILNPHESLNDASLSIIEVTLAQSTPYTYIPGFIKCQTYFEDVLTKNLRIAKLTYPVDSLRRAFRFNEKGFKPCKETLFIMSKAIHDMDENDIASLNKEVYYIVD